MTNDGISWTAYHSGMPSWVGSACAATISEVDSDSA